MSFEILDRGQKFSHFWPTSFLPIRYPKFNKIDTNKLVQVFHGICRGYGTTTPISVGTQMTQSSSWHRLWVHRSRQGERAEIITMPWPVKIYRLPRRGFGKNLPEKSLRPPFLVGKKSSPPLFFLKKSLSPPFLS